MQNIKKLKLELMKFVVWYWIKLYFSFFIKSNSKFSGFEEQQREQHDNEYVEEMGEDEYDALPEEEKQRIDQKRLQRKKDRILKYE